ncbi:MAG: histidine phosphatase family protein [Clostridia bacterium]|nr:histidine phosphatase family protein [Clostridia bacterium]
MTNVYFVRHATPNYGNHDDLTRELTAQGLKDRERVTSFLLDKEIDAVFSSPYRRSIDTVKQFADAVNLQIKLIDDFRERKIDSAWIDNFDSFCKKQWENFDFKLQGGESLGEVQKRNINALNRVLQTHANQNIVIGSHGTALSTIINYYDPSFGCEEFYRIKDLMPFIVKFVFDKDKCIGIEKYEI